MKMADDSSPPSCGICLSDGGGAVRGRIDSCDHYFCFDCIVQWSKVESRCPMCKRRFTSIRKHVDGFFRLFPFQHGVVNVPQRDQGLSRDLALRQERLLNQWSEMRLELIRMRLEREATARTMKKFMFLYELGVIFCLFTFLFLYHNNYW